MEGFYAKSKWDLSTTFQNPEFITIIKNNTITKDDNNTNNKLTHRVSGDGMSHP